LESDELIIWSESGQVQLRLVNNGENRQELMVQRKKKIGGKVQRQEKGTKNRKEKMPGTVCQLPSFLQYVILETVRSMQAMSFKLRLDSTKVYNTHRKSWRHQRGRAPINAFFILKCLDSPHPWVTPPTHGSASKWFARSGGEEGCWCRFAQLFDDFGWLIGMNSADITYEDKRAVQ
jgi:hypothetical protein